MGLLRSGYRQQVQRPTRQQVAGRSDQRANRIYELWLAFSLVILASNHHRKLSLSYHDLGLTKTRIYLGLQNRGEFSFCTWEKRGHGQIRGLRRRPRSNSTYTPTIGFLPRPFPTYNANRSSERYWIASLR